MIILPSPLSQVFEELLEAGTDQKRARGKFSQKAELITERCPSWPKERDWKSRVLPKSGTEGSNPSLSAILVFALT